MVRFTTTALALLLFSVPAWASGDGYVCTYTKECVGLDACQDTSYELSFVFDGDVAIVDDVNGKSKATRLPVESSSVLSVAGQTGGTTRMITTPIEGGLSHFTLHMNEAQMAITYKGTCEAVEGV
ncbi:MAG: hypothetical protein AAF903_00105 [Pseudomonadota bacterium]